MEADLKKFTKTNKRFEDRITVTGTTAFGVPTTFYDNHNIKDYKYVVLYYDERRKIVGFHFTNSDEEEHKFSVLKSKKGYGGSIVCSSFFNTYSIDPKKYKGRYEWEKKDYPGIGDVYLIQLKEKILEDKTTPENTLNNPSGGGNQTPEGAVAE